MDIRMNISLCSVKAKIIIGEKYKNSFWLDFRFDKKTSVFQERQKAVIFE